MVFRRGAGDQQNVGRAMKKPGKRDLHRGGLQGRRYAVKLGRLQRSETSQREERDISDALLGQNIDESIVSALRDVVEVLDANDLRDFPSFLELPWSDVAETDVANQPLTLQLGEHSKRFRDGALRRLLHSTYAKVDDIEMTDTEVAQIVLHAVNQVLT